METTVLYALLGLTGVNLIISAWGLRRDRNESTFREISRMEKALRDELGRGREENARNLKENREELNAGLKGFQEMTEVRLERVREAVENRLKALQEENSGKLEAMRTVVDEKLQASVEKRFNDSFRLISERLDQVHKGLGEMQTLANGVGDLKKVLTNVKTRGTLGEIQLGAILEQFMSPEQYVRNATTKPGGLERVEFAIKLPGSGLDDKSVLLPVDSKFPVEDYLRLTDAYEKSCELSSAEVESAAKAFEASLKKCARDIRDKYINPPVTTDFALMFVPTEGLYAEILRNTGLFELLQREYRITVVGPGNLAAFLSSLQMGFRTLAIERRSSEVWELLGAVKTEFGHFGDILEKTRKKLNEAANVIDKAGVRSRAIERRLRQVEALPAESETVFEDADPLEEKGMAEDGDAEESVL